MLLKDYDNPSEEELEYAFREVYYFAQALTVFGRVLVWVIYRTTGDRLFVLVAQKMHRETVGTLHEVSSHDIYNEFFRRKRLERAQMRNMARDFVPAEEVE